MFIGNTILLVIKRKLNLQKRKENEVKKPDVKKQDSGDHRHAYVQLYEDKRAPTKNDGFTSYTALRCAICVKIVFFPIENFRSTTVDYQKKTIRELRDAGYNIEENY